MPGAPPATPAAYMMRGVSLFASGQYRGKRWAPGVLRQMAENARRLGPGEMKLLVPPAVLGHEEDQEWLERTDLPAAGWVDPESVRIVPDPQYRGELILKGDVVNIPPEIKEELLDSGKYRFGSAEIYDDFKDDFGNSYGHALRRFALLGGEVPQVKRLGSLPPAEPMSQLKTFSERRGVRIVERFVRHGSLLHTYAETVMDRQSMMAAAKAAMPGVSQATLDALTDDQLADLVKNLPSPTAAAAATPAPASGQMADAGATMSHDDLVNALTQMGMSPEDLAGMSDEDLQALYEQMQGGGDNDNDGDTTTMGDPSSMSREEMIAELVAAGQDASQLDTMSDDDLRNLYTQVCGGSTATAPAAAATPMSEPRRKPKPRGVNPMSEAQALARNARRLNNQVEAELRRLRISNSQQKKQDATSFCDKLVADGKTTPAMVKAAFLPALLALDNTRSVHRFTENGVTRNLTAYELKKIELAKLPALIRFGERFPSGSGDNKDKKAAEVAKVEKFAELHGSALRTAGSDPKKLVETAKKMAESKADFTAADVIGRDAAAMVS